MKKLSLNWVLVGILILAAFLRTYKLGQIPPSMTPDEAALGYNAYSILKTGRDEYGQLLPIVFKSFGDYKPGLYVYWSAPFIAILGLSEFAVRFGSALAGVAGVLLFYSVVNKLFGDRKLALISAFLLSICPWHIHYSRGAWEINLSLSLTLAGIYFFLLSLEKQKYLVVSALFFGLTLLTYQGAKLSSLVVVVPLVLIYWKRIVGFDRRIIVLAVLLGLLLSAPILQSMFTGKTGRLKVFSVFSYRRPADYLESQLAQGKEKVGDLTYYLFHSEGYNLLRGIAGRWFNHYSDRFLFFEGDWQNPRHSSPNNGMLLLADLPLILLGFYALSRMGSRKEALFVWAWILFAPLPSALSRDQVHAVRGFNLVAPLIILDSLGVAFLPHLVKGLRIPGLRYAFYLSACAVYLASLVYFLDSYFVHLAEHNSIYWEYGYREAVEAVQEALPRYDKVHVRQSYAQPYIYFLFYLKYDPASYQKQAHLIESEYGDVGRVEKFDNYYFLPIDWQRNRGDEGTIFVADPLRIPPQDSSDPGEFEILKEIKYLDGSTSLRVVGVKNKLTGL